MDNSGPRRGRRYGGTTLSEMNVVPLVDVVLVLLIIFMLTAQAMQFGLDRSAEGQDRKGLGAGLERRQHYKGRRTVFQRQGGQHQRTCGDGEGEQEGQGEPGLHTCRQGDAVRPDRQSCSGIDRRQDWRSSGDTDR